MKIMCWLNTLHLHFIQPYIIVFILVNVLSESFIFFFSKAFLVDIFARPNSDGFEHTYDNAGQPSARRTDCEESKTLIS